MYEDLLLPWMVNPVLAAEFPKSLHVRREWNRNGQLELGEDDFFGGSNIASLEDLAASLGTASMVTRWRTANPYLAKTNEDCVMLAMKAVQEAMYDAGNGGLDQVRIKTGSATTLLLFTRSGKDQYISTE